MKVLNEAAHVHRGEDHLERDSVKTVTEIQSDQNTVKIESKGAHRKSAILGFRFEILKKVNFAKKKYFDG